jgi:hypothetical protein
MFDNKDFVGMTDNTHQDPFIALHNPAVLTPGTDQAIRPMKDMKDYTSGPLIFPSGACVVVDMHPEGPCHKLYQQVMSGIFYPKNKVVLVGKRMN